MLANLAGFREFVRMGWPGPGWLDGWAYGEIQGPRGLGGSYRL